MTNSGIEQGTLGIEIEVLYHLSADNYVQLAIFSHPYISKAALQHKPQEHTILRHNMKHIQTSISKHIYKHKLAKVT